MKKKMVIAPKSLNIQDKNELQLLGQ